jgi:3-methyladenine DNA glycosylase AlkD
MEDKICSAITEALIRHSDEKTRLSSQRFFKEAIQCHGVKSAVTERIAKDYFRQVRDRPKSVIFDLCEQLWQTGYLEECGVACFWSQSLHKQYKPHDLPVFERWVDRYVTNWATCDTLCNHSVGTFVEMYPEYIRELKRWARSENRWMKRAAAVSLIIPARRGKF